MKYSILFIFLTFLASCSDPCEGLECLTEDAFSFTIKSSDSGADLLFGNDLLYSEEDIDIFYFEEGIKQSAYSFYDYNAVSVTLKPGVEDYFVEAGNKTDTINIQFFRRPSSECCPSTTEITRKSVNGQEVSEDTWIIALYR